ncbi:hypothetical protein AK812_SmicGene47117, partial [Symbiodinium microadriaticum]
AALRPRSFCMDFARTFGRSKSQLWGYSAAFWSEFRPEPGRRSASTITAALPSKFLFVQAVEKRRLQGKTVLLKNTASVPTLCHIEMYSYARAWLPNERKTAWTRP